MSGGTGTLQRIFHLTAVVADRDAAVAPLVEWFGAAVLYEAEDEMFGTPMRRSMLWFADCLVEVIEPAPGTPLHGFVERFGGGLNGLGLEVRDAAATERRFGERGVSVAIRYGDDMFATRPSQTAGLALQISARPSGVDPRDGASVPESRGAIVPRHLAFVAALVDDPAATSRQLADLLGTDPGGPPGAAGPPATVGLGDGMLALWARGEAASSPWGDRSSRPPVVGVSLAVDDVDAAVSAVVAAGAPQPARHGELAVFDGAVPFAVALCPGLLPGDPRR